MIKEHVRVSPQKLYAFDFPKWKHPILRQCFPGIKVHHLKPGQILPEGASLALWGCSQLPHGVNEHTPIYRLEDGFLRSVGLGADLVRPISWVVDREGIYYDASRPSSLERWLNTADFDESLLARAFRLRERIVALGLSKYNVGRCTWQRPKGSRRVILVPGQVESDASLKYGVPGKCNNIDLLRKVRERNPHAYLIYKPHPDVVARMRLAGKNEAYANRWCDEVLTDVPIGDLLLAVDEVHVWTSLAGFEALLRGKLVTCHGLPFYAGWGLTQDMLKIPRRSRRLTLDELVAGVLIEYPLYLSRDGQSLISAEDALDALVSWRQIKSAGRFWWLPIHRFFLRRLYVIR